MKCNPTRLKRVLTTVKSHKRHVRKLRKQKIVDSHMTTVKKKVAGRLKKVRVRVKSHLRKK